MPANIVHGTNIAFIVATDDDRVFTNIKQKVIAGLRDLTDMARIDPAFEYDIFELSLISDMRPIEIWVHSEA